jgi:hypothetical protein
VGWRVFIGLGRMRGVGHLALGALLRALRDQEFTDLLEFPSLLPGPSAIPGDSKPRSMSDRKFAREMFSIRIISDALQSCGRTPAPRFRAVTSFMDKISIEKRRRRGQSAGCSIQDGVLPDSRKARQPFWGFGQSSCSRSRCSSELLPRLPATTWARSEQTAEWIAARYLGSSLGSRA